MCLPLAMSSWTRSTSRSSCTTWVRRTENWHHVSRFPARDECADKGRVTYCLPCGHVRRHCECKWFSSCKRCASYAIADVRRKQDAEAEEEVQKKLVVYFDGPEPKLTLSSFRVQSATILLPQVPERSL